MRGMKNRIAGLVVVLCLGLLSSCKSPDGGGEADPVAAARRQVAMQTSEVARVRALVQSGEAQETALQDAEKELAAAKTALEEAQRAAAAKR